MLRVAMVLILLGCPEGHSQEGAAPVQEKEARIKALADLLQTFSDDDYGEALKRLPAKTAARPELASRQAILASAYTTLAGLEYRQASRTAPSKSADQYSEDYQRVTGDDAKRLAVNPDSLQETGWFTDLLGVLALGGLSYMTYEQIRQRHHSGGSSPASGPTGGSGPSTHRCQAGASWTGARCEWNERPCYAQFAGQTIVRFVDGSCFLVPEWFPKWGCGGDGTPAWTGFSYMTPDVREYLAQYTLKLANPADVRVGPLGSQPTEGCVASEISHDAPWGRAILNRPSDCDPQWREPGGQCVSRISYIQDPNPPALCDPAPLYPDDYHCPEAPHQEVCPPGAVPNGYKCESVRFGGGDICANSSSLKCRSGGGGLHPMRIEVARLNDSIGTIQTELAGRQLKPEKTADLHRKMGALYEQLAAACANPPKADDEAKPADETEARGNSNDAQDDPLHREMKSMDKMGDEMHREIERRQP